ncbi:MAG: right-handed parallel beta-helix repeat-containing protein [Acetobacteraceae bacterium]|nr:right-handed parallel beta-helix repeat-containing protein [Acetobacteraceae bacterium]MBV8522185.1 right-handed parallel beta-helix repeat-containing protein [Acetobacteraceae bacterium]
MQAGNYINDFAEIKTKITIEGVGGMANLVATTSPPNGKAILTTDTDVTLSNLAFSGANVSDGNGAGVRYQSGNLTINNSYFHDNQDGLLAASDPSGSITINNSEFAHNGTGDGQTHNLYVDDVGSLAINNSYFHDAVVGHEIKSRAANTVIQNSRIQDQDGTASYSVDLPNGGNATIKNDVIQQGPNSQNPAIISAGEEGNIQSNSSLTVTGNTIINDLNSPSAVAVVNDTPAIATISNNSIYGLTSDEIAHGPAAISGNVFLSSEPALDTSSPYASSTASTGSDPSGNAAADPPPASSQNSGQALDIAGTDPGGTQPAAPGAGTILASNGTFTHFAYGHMGTGLSDQGMLALGLWS